MTRQQRLSQSILALEITAFVIAPLLLLFAALSQSTLKAYRQNGVPITARVVDTWRGSSRFAPYCIKVGFFDKSILEAGVLHTPEICERVPGPVWASYEPDNEIAIVFLPEDLGGKAILKDSLDPANLTPIHKTITGTGGLDGRDRLDRVSPDDGKAGQIGTKTENRTNAGLSSDTSESGC